MDVAVFALTSIELLDDVLQGLRHSKNFIHNLCCARCHFNSNLFRLCSRPLQCFVGKFVFVLSTHKFE